MRILPFAISFGLAFGIALSWVVLFGGVLGLSQAGGSPALALLIVNSYPGLEISLRGVALTFVWGFVDGGMLGLITAGAYNLISKD